MALAEKQGPESELLRTGREALLREIEGGPAGSNAGAAPVDGLTPREIEVLCMVADGASNQEIADRLVLSIRTVERHISTIYEKIGATGRVARATATAYAIRQGLVQAESRKTESTKR